MRTFAWIAAGAIVAGLAGCTVGDSPAPVWVCPVATYTVYEDVGCTCDLPQGTAIQDRAILEEGTMAAIVAPPGTYPPDRRVRVHHEGEVTEGLSGPDGSLFVGFRNRGVDLRFRRVQVEVEGGGRGVVTLDGHEEAWLAPLAERPPEFPEGAIAVEHPEGTIWVRARLEGPPGASEVEHALWALPESAWADTPPRLGDVVERRMPGEEGFPLMFVTLHASGSASGCYLRGGSAGRCECPAHKRAAGTCRHSVSSTDEMRPPPPPQDAGAPF